MFASRHGRTNIVQLLLEHGADADLQDKVSSSAKVLSVSVCLTAVYLAYSTTTDVVIVLCGCTTEVKSKVHKLSLLPYQGNSLSVAYILPYPHSLQYP